MKTKKATNVRKTKEILVHIPHQIIYFLKNNQNNISL